MSESNGIDPLAQAMVDLMAQGMTLSQVASKVGLSTAACHERMIAHLEDTSSHLSILQMRMIQLRRLEHIISALWKQVMDGDLITQGRNVKNLIEVIGQITELMDLRKDRLRDEQVRLTQAQTQMILAAVDMVRVNMLEKVISVVGEERREELSCMWHGAFSELAAGAVEEKSEATVRMGPGAGSVELNPVPVG